MCDCHSTGGVPGPMEVLLPRALQGPAHGLDPGTLFPEQLLPGPRGKCVPVGLRWEELPSGPLSGCRPGGRGFRVCLPSPGPPSLGLAGVSLSALVGHLPSDACPGLLPREPAGVPTRWLRRRWGPSGRMGVRSAGGRRGFQSLQAASQPCLGPVGLSAGHSFRRLSASVSLGVN